MPKYITLFKHGKKMHINLDCFPIIRANQYGGENCFQLMSFHSRHCGSFEEEVCVYRFRNRPSI